MARHRSGELNRQMDSNSSRAASRVELASAPTEVSETFRSPLPAGLSMHIAYWVLR